MCFVLALNSTLATEARVYDSSGMNYHRKVSAKAQELEQTLVSRCTHGIATTKLAGTFACIGHYNVSTNTYTFKRFLLGTSSGND